MEQLEDEEVVLWGAKGSLDFPSQCPKWGRWWINKLAEKAPSDEEFGTVKGNIEQFWLIVWLDVYEALEDKI
jgi:hypothetical protein